jgi:hypothetical protein
MRKIHKPFRPHLGGVIASRINAMWGGSTRGEYRFALAYESAIAATRHYSDRLP